MDIPILILLLLLGLCVGSFCNVLIYRIPKGEEFVKTSSHCMTCGHNLSWFELIPVFSFPPSTPSWKLLTALCGWSPEFCSGGTG